jgi:hypothetical protein
MLKDGQEVYSFRPSHGAARLVAFLHVVQAVAALTRLQEMDMIFFEMPSGVDAFPFASRVVGKRPFTLAVHPRWIPVASAPDPDAQVPTVPRFQTPRFPQPRFQRLQFPLLQSKTPRFPQPRSSVPVPTAAP